MSVTISEIADKLGVSPMTVSRALRGVGRIGADTRERVLEAAKRFGYRPNLSARAMRSGRFGCVALVVGSQVTQCALSHDLLWGIEDALEAKGLYLAITRLPDEPSSAQGRVPQILSQWMTDGLLVNCTHPIPGPMMEQIQKHHVPTVWINRRGDTDCVYADELDAARRGTEYLLGLGHKRIACADYNFPAAPNAGTMPASAKDRFDGYAQAMRAAGLEPRSLDGALCRDQRVSFSRALLSTADRPTAIIAHSYHQTAAPILSAAATLGISVPQELSVLTIDHSPVTEWDLQIATMVLPDREMGRTSVHLLLDKLANPAAELAGKPLQAQLVTGNSCLGPKAEASRGKSKRHAVAS